MPCWWRQDLTQLRNMKRILSDFAGMVLGSEEDFLNSTSGR
jgi:hypothetical protein